MAPYQMSNSKQMNTWPSVMKIQSGNWIEWVKDIENYISISISIDIEIDIDRYINFGPDQQKHEDNTWFAVTTYPISFWETAITPHLE